MDELKKNIKVIISGGGTGGHVFPAIAIAHALKEKDPSIDILFVGAEGRMEMEKVPEAGYRIKGLWISGFQRRITVDNLLFPVKLLSSIIKSRKIVMDFRPDVAVGVGGYASGPMMYVASKAKIPVLIQEQNSFPGITNRLLAKEADKVCVAYDNMDRWFPAKNIFKTGNPVRQNIVKSDVSRSEGLKHFGLNENKRTILVVGGSLGSRTINESMAAGIEQIVEKGYQVIWQTGKFYYEQMRNKNKGAKDHVKIQAFIREMPKAYAAADVIISRAGAIAISELCIVGKPVILVPSPNVSEDHQTKNALALQGNSAALMVRDIEAREKLAQTVLNLLGNEEEQMLLQENIKKMAITDSADRIAEEVLKLVKRK